VTPAYDPNPALTQRLGHQEVPAAKQSEHGSHAELDQLPGDLISDDLGVRLGGGHRRVRPFTQFGH